MRAENAELRQMLASLYTQSGRTHNERALGKLWGGVVGTSLTGVEASLSSTKQSPLIGGALRIGDEVLPVNTVSFGNQCWHAD